MKYLYIDQLRKIKFNKLNFISLSILVIVISLTFTMIKTSVERLEENYEPYLEQQNVEDFQFGLSSIDIDLLGGTALWTLCQELELDLQCAINISIGTEASYTQLNHIVNQRIEERPDLVEPVVEEYLEDIIEEYDFVVEQRWISDVQDGDFDYRFLTRTYEINLPHLVDGVLPENDNEIAIFPEFAEYNNINIDDTITILDKEYIVKGFVNLPDYSYPIYYMNAMDIQYETIVLTNETTIENIGTNIDKMYVAKGDLSQLLEEQTFKEVTETDVSTLSRNTQHIKKIRPRSANYKLVTLPLEVDNAKIFMNAFISMFVLFTGLLLTIFLKRYIEKNKKDIDTLQSLGYSNIEIAKSLMVFPVIISSMSIIGYIIGLIGSTIMFESYASRYLFPKAEFMLYPDIFFISVILPIVFILLISFIFISLSLRRREERIRRVRIKVFKFTPLKTILQSFVLLFTVSVMILFSINANNIFTKFLEDTKVGNNFEEALRLDYFTNEDVEDSYEPFTRLRATMLTVNGDETDFGFAMYGIDTDTTLKALIDNDPSKNELLNDGIIISEYVSYNQNLEIGDIVTFEIKGTEFEREIVGINNELIENNAFMLKEDLNTSYNLDNTYYNGIYTNDNEYQSSNIDMRISYNQALDDIAVTMRASANIVNFLLILSAIISIFMFGFILTNYLAENRLNISILKSIGYNNKEINQKYIIAIIVTFILGFLIAIPTTTFVFDLLLRSIIDQLGYILVLEVTLVNIVISLSVLVVIFILTLFFINKYYENVSIIEILKTNIK